MQSKVIASLQLTTRSKATDRARPVTSQRFGALKRRPPIARATGGLALPRRNRFGWLPPDLAHQSFAVFGPEALDRVGARR